MLSDLFFWENIKATFSPLKKKEEKVLHPLPPRLHVRRAPGKELLSTLDLHGLTVEEAYQSLRRFIILHMQAHTKLITIITGKGTPTKEGQIHREISGWLETPFFREKINQVRWLNGGGALEIMLKRKKKK